MCENGGFLLSGSHISICIAHHYFYVCYCTWIDGLSALCLGTSKGMVIPMMLTVQFDLFSIATL